MVKATTIGQKLIFEINDSHYNLNPNNRQMAKSYFNFEERLKTN